MVIAQVVDRLGNLAIDVDQVIEKRAIAGSFERSNVQDYLEDLVEVLCRSRSPAFNPSGVRFFCQHISVVHRHGTVQPSRIDS
ncbi:hypothetical protein A7G45_16435 [Mycolicibacterium llatzerense]|nr:hypothetical protein [Mycolicibacterium llatzerense]MCT7372387.1 hypothetical protein [Mycolicibacterium llatzerense]